ncbi:shikimate dehydrogenase [Candidatus Pelagibacter sp.]|nr:shikimate dehydrogenase [Candidatus Pelagibacter sp.]
MKKYFVIGNPIDHSLSPKLHNHWLKENKIDAVYDKKKIDENDLENIITKLKKKQINGINVTVPFKKIVIPYLDKLSFEAEQTQSVNTILLNNDNLEGHNTDITGFIKSIKNLNFDIKGKKIFILGAGGVVPSIIFALNKMNVSKIIISNRTKKKAEDLKSQFHNLEILDWGDINDFDVIINATSLGLNKESINLDFSKFTNNKLFYDVIYNPAETNFLKEGKKLGNRTENGKLMFIYQAFEAFKLWHGVEPQINSNTLEIIKND